MSLRATGHLNRYLKPWEVLQTQNETVFAQNKPKTTRTNENHIYFFTPNHHKTSYTAFHETCQHVPSL
jgi:hypothetical protein